MITPKFYPHDNLMPGQLQQDPKRQASFITPKNKNITSFLVQTNCQAQFSDTSEHILFFAFFVSLFCPNNDSFCQFVCKTVLQPRFEYQIQSSTSLSFTKVPLALPAKGVFNGLLFSNIEELKSQKLETGFRVIYKLNVIFLFLRPKSATYICYFSQITISKLFSQSFTCFPLKFW